MKNTIEQHLIQNSTNQKISKIDVKIYYFIYNNFWLGRVTLNKLTGISIVKIRMIILSAKLNNLNQLLGLVENENQIQEIKRKIKKVKIPD